MTVNSAPVTLTVHTCIHQTKHEIVCLRSFSLSLSFSVCVCGRSQVTVANTTALFAAHAVGALNDAGVSVGSVVGTCPLPAVPRAAVPQLQSDTLLNLVNHTLQESDNLYAEACWFLGWEVYLRAIFFLVCCSVCVCVCHGVQAFLRIIGSNSPLSQQLGVRAAGLATVRTTLQSVCLYVCSLFSFLTFVRLCVCVCLSHSGGRRCAPDVCTARRKASSRRDC